MNRKNGRYFLLISILIVLFGLIYAYRDSINDVPTLQTNDILGRYSNIIVDLQIQAYSNNTIEILNNDDFTSAGFSGTGSSSDPYILKDAIISNSTASIISIENTDAHFIIQNCSFNGILGIWLNNGIDLVNVTNGVIRNNTIKNCSDGIKTDFSIGIEISNNTFYNNSYCCIELHHSHFNNLSHNNNYNGYHGMHVRYSSYNNTLSNNIINDFTQTGISISHSVNVTMIENNVSLCDSAGISFNNVTNALVLGNNVTDDSYALGISYCENIAVLNNLFVDNFGTISLGDSDFCKIIGNNIDIYGGGTAITITTAVSENNTIENNYIKGGSTTGTGISTQFDNFTTINNNHIYDCHWGIRIGAFSFGSIVTCNLVNWTTYQLVIDGNYTTVEWNSFITFPNTPVDNGYFNTIRYNYYDWHISPDADLDGFADIPFNYTGTSNNQDLNPLNGSSILDNDEDGLSNFEEIVLGTNPDDPDSDGDTITDIDELTIYLTNPTSNDTDIDGLDDFEEVNLGKDGFYTDPLLNDTDLDGLLDGEEYTHNSNPLVQDTDSDFLLDGDEVNNFGTSPTNNDTESDGLPDGYEVANGLSPLLDDANEDPDIDDLTNLEEYREGTDPHIADTDGDSYNDGEEILAGTDPLDSNDFPQIPTDIPFFPPIAEDPTVVIIISTASIASAAIVSGLMIQSIIGKGVDLLTDNLGKVVLANQELLGSIKDQVSGLVKKINEELVEVKNCPKCGKKAVSAFCHICGTTVDFEKARLLKERILED